MENRVVRYGVLGLRALLTVIFLLAGVSKLIGVEFMVEMFETIGLGQWFRYVTGAVEVGSAALLWLPGFQAIGAGLLTLTMIGAALAHALVIGPSMVPAIVLGIISAIVFWVFRSQFSGRATASH